MGAKMADRMQPGATCATERPKHWEDWHTPADLQNKGIESEWREDTVAGLNRKEAENCVQRC